MSVDYWETFMSLLRAGLWEQDLELPCTPDVDAWELVLSLGRVQAVMGLVVRGIAHLPEEQRDLEELEPVLQAIKEALSRANHTYARVQVTLFQILAESRLHPIIQKGSEAAKYYADPSVRQVGDIDLYLPPEEFKRARTIFPKARRASDGALVLARDLVLVEVHPRYYDIHRPAKKLPEPGSPCGEILLLSAHIFKHVIGHGVGCKQLCDLAIAITRLDGKYDKNELRAALKYAGLLRWHNLVCSLLVYDFGLDLIYCLPDFEPVRTTSLRRIVQRSGRFGNHPKTKAATAKAFLRRLPFSLSYCPRETFATIWELIVGNLRK
ncbi:MAG: nucleotidyltransferase family protein [Bacteroidales bacterium]|nr:nucleotidyltransferase family protein [Bacteroidales bacterium]